VNEEDEQQQRQRIRRRLLHRIQRQFQTVTRKLTVGELTFDFTRIADPDVVLDQVVEEADRRERVSGKREHDEDLHLPYWAEFWDSGMGIAQHLLKQPAPWRVLDLGCGMGFAGTVAAALGGHVLFADLEPPALLFASLNSLPWRAQVRTRRVNWRTDHLDERFDLIIGADILYERAQWEFLDPFWRRHLAPGGTVLLGEPGRQTGDLFPEWIVQQKWQLNSLQEIVSTRPVPVRLFQLTRS
jgi:predicted nicotinamide N-methyase